MKASRPPSRRRLREFARVVFCNKLLLSVATLAGLGLGVGRACRAPLTYRGHVELASSDGSTIPRLPDAASLRRLALAPENLATLTKDPDAESAIPADVRLSPLLSAPGGRSVWELTADLAAPNVEDAKSRLRAYVEQLQKQFSDQSQRIADARPTPLPEHVPTATSAPPLVRQALVLAPSREAGDALIRERGELRQAMVRLEIERQEKLDAIRSIEKKEELTILPRGVEKDFPETKTNWDRLAKRLAERAALTSTVTPKHPSLRANERAIEETKDLLRRQLDMIANSYRVDVQSLHARLEGDKKSLADLDARIDEWSKREEKIQDALLKSASVAPASAATTPVASTETPPAPGNDVLSHVGSVLVAGPVIDPTPLRPRPWRDGLLGALGGALVGLLFAGIRHGADQRIYLPYEVEELGLGVEVLGTIPQSRQAPAAMESWVGRGTGA